MLAKGGPGEQKGKCLACKMEQIEDLREHLMLDCSPREETRLTTGLRNKIREAECEDSTRERVVATILLLLYLRIRPVRIDDGAIMRSGRKWERQQETEFVGA